jgi:hypothetical protein
VWGVVPPVCTRLLVVTDGYASDPEMQLFFTELTQRAHMQQLLHADAPFENVDGGAADGVLEIPHRCVYDPLNDEVRYSTCRMSSIHHGLRFQANRCFERRLSQ